MKGYALQFRRKARFMTTVLLSPPMAAAYGDALMAAGVREVVVSEVVAGSAGPTLAPEVLARVEVAFFSLDLITNSTKYVLAPEFEVFSRNLLAAPNLRWLHVAVAGADRPVFLQVLERGVCLTTSSGANAAAVAHSALAGILVLARNALHWMDAQRRHAWEPRRGDKAPRDLEGTTALIVGFGPIGQKIAALLNMMGVKAIGLRRSPVPADAARDVHAYAALPSLAAKADWLILACPLSDETRNLVNADVLAALPAAARVINVGRGGVLDEAALLEGLRSGKIGGAYLDVFANEPLPADSPFWDMPNVLISPHCAGSTNEHNRRAAEMFIDNFGRYSRGEALFNVVPPPVRPSQ